MDWKTFRGHLLLAALFIGAALTFPIESKAQTLQPGTYWVCNEYGSYCRWIEIKPTCQQDPWQSGCENHHRKHHRNDRDDLKSEEKLLLQFLEELMRRN